MIRQPDAPHPAADATPIRTKRTSKSRSKGQSRRLPIPPPMMTEHPTNSSITDKPTQTTKPTLVATPSARPKQPTSTAPAANAQAASDVHPMNEERLDEHTGTIAALVRLAEAKGASDIHIRVGEFTRFRIRGELKIQVSLPIVTPKIFKHFLKEMLNPELIAQFKRDKALDTAIVYPGFLRCRINCFDSLMGGAIVMRLVPLDVPTIDDLGLPQVFKQLVSRPQGLILVTGPTGSGRSTSIAAMISYLNEVANRHIVTIEDPIEYVHTSMNCLISQREVGLHTRHCDALRAALQEDPDVIVLGELHDRASIDTAIKAVQAGRLVLGTVNSQSPIEAVNRLLNSYHPDEQPAMRMQIIESLGAVITQQLVPTNDGPRTAVHEILINTPAMTDCLLLNDEAKALQLMELDVNEGMQVMNQRLSDLVMIERIRLDDAMKASPDAANLLHRVSIEKPEPRPALVDKSPVVRSKIDRTRERPLANLSWGIAIIFGFFGIWGGWWAKTIQIKQFNNGLSQLSDMDKVWEMNSDRLLQCQQQGDAQCEIKLKPIASGTR